jgi:hypothetical protein
MTMQESVTTETRKKIADHGLLNSTGQPTDTEEEAKGYSYKLLANGETFTWNWDDATEAERIMLAIFGAKTLTTNEVSQVRNGKEYKDSDDPAQYDKAMEAVRARFADLRDGKWVDRTREGGVGTRVNRDALAEAICKVLVENQKKTQDEVDSGYKATVRQRLDDDAEWLGKMRKFPPVSAAYALIVGKDSGITVDSMLD